MVAADGPMPSAGRASGASAEPPYHGNAVEPSGFTTIFLSQWM
jgi:hypothetical protein